MAPAALGDRERLGSVPGEPAEAAGPGAERPVEAEATAAKQEAARAMSSVSPVGCRLRSLPDRLQPVRRDAWFPEE